MSFTSIYEYARGPMRSAGAHCDDDGMLGESKAAGGDGTAAVAATPGAAGGDDDGLSSALAALSSAEEEGALIQALEEIAARGQPEHKQVVLKVASEKRQSLPREAWTRAVAFGFGAAVRTLSARKGWSDQAAKAASGSAEPRKTLPCGNPFGVDIYDPQGLAVRQFAFPAALGHPDKGYQHDQVYQAAAPWAEDAGRFDQERRPRICKVVMVGSPRTGKTAYMLTAADGHYRPMHGYYQHYQLGIDFKILRVMDQDNDPAKIQLWDLPLGHQRFRVMNVPRSYARGAHAFLCFFRVTKDGEDSEYAGDRFPEGSFREAVAELERMLPHANDDARQNVVLVASKVDSGALCHETMGLARAYAAEHGYPLIPVSCKEGFNVHAPLATAIRLDKMRRPDPHPAHPVRAVQQPPPQQKQGCSIM